MNTGNKALREKIAFFSWNPIRGVFVITEGLAGRELGAFKSIKTTREVVERWNHFVSVQNPMGAAR